MNRIAEGAYFDELETGQVFDGAPGLTLTAGHGALHQAIVGDGLRLVFHRAPVIGGTLRITTVDQRDRPVLAFWRCAMLPLRDPDAPAGPPADMAAVGEPARDAALAGVAAGWALDPFLTQLWTCVRNNAR
jgi:hypothetical protein